ncbi:UNVERIFIED_CONTAM: hypothetical protein ABID98_005969 [Brevibacillus sp. OAP136]|nr:hypothetical protein [Brevibacillus fluminis]
MLTKFLRWMLSETEDVHVERKLYVQNEINQFVPSNPGMAMGANLLYRS